MHSLVNKVFQDIIIRKLMILNSQSFLKKENFESVLCTQKIEKSYNLFFSFKIYTLQILIDL